MAAFKIEKGFDYEIEVSDRSHRAYVFVSGIDTLTFDKIDALIADLRQAQHAIKQNGTL